MRIRAIKLSLALSTVLWANAAVLAQALASVEPTSGETTTAPADNTDIIVTAQFRATNLQDTPLAISAVSGAELARRGLTDIQSIANTAPSVTLTPGPAAFGKTMVSYIRGVGANDFNPAFDPSVGYYVDDIYYASLAGSTFDLMDLERVEILRGPQGTLFGKNTIGGAIRLISKKPNETLGGYLEGTTGSFDRVDIRGSLNIPLAGDNLAVRLSGIHRERRGYVTRLDFACANPAQAGSLPRIAPAGADCVIGHDGGENIDAFRVAVRAVPVDGMEFNISFDHTDDRSDPGALRLIATGPDAVLNGPGIPEAGVFPINTYQFLPKYGISYDDRFVTNDPYTNYATYRNPITGLSLEPKGRVRQSGFSFNADFDLTDNLKFRSITGYRDMLSRFVYDSDLSPLPLVTQWNEVRYDQLSQELQLLGDALDKKVEWVIGGYYFKGNATYTSISDLLVAGLYAPSNDRFAVEDFSAFAHLTVHLTDRLNIIGGIRYTKETKGFHLFHPLDFYLPGGTGATIPGPVLDYTAPTLAYSNWDPKISIDYKIADDVMVYAQYSTGFRGGGFNNRPFTAAQVFSVSPEFLDAYEVGIKSRLFDRRLTLNLTAFQSDYSDIQQVVAGVDTSGTPFSAPLNVGDARIRGIELESSLRLGGLRFNLAANYLDAKIKSARAPDNGLAVPPSALPQPGTRLAFAPEYRVNAGIEYEVTMGDLGTLIPRFDLAYQSSVKYDSTGSSLSTEPSYTVVDGRLTWAYRDDLSLALGVTNIFEKYYNSFIFNTYVQDLGSLVVSPSRPREWSLTLRKAF